ncbi:MAG: hypothetical protein WC819_05675 [Parcubacteria group bacterium]|jgi:hypothetical protein
MENFDPYDPKYKSVKDLPGEEKEKYADLPEGGFVRKSAIRETEIANALAEEIRRKEDSQRPVMDKILGKNKSGHLLSDELRGPYDAHFERQENMTVDQKNAGQKEGMLREIQERQGRIEMLQEDIARQEEELAEMKGALVKYQEKFVELKTLYDAMDKSM